MVENQPGRDIENELETGASWNFRVQAQSVDIRV